MTARAEFGCRWAPWPSIRFSRVTCRQLSSSNDSFRTTIARQLNATLYERLCWCAHGCEWGIHDRGRHESSCGMGVVHNACPQTIHRTCTTASEVGVPRQHLEAHACGGVRMTKGQESHQHNGRVHDASALDRASVNETVFHFTADGVNLEFAGSEKFVEKQVLRFRRFLESAVGIPRSPEQSHTAREGASSFADFAARRPIRAGRGAIQDRIILSFHYLQHVKGRGEISGDDVLWCFERAGWERPKNLHNALGILKRKLEHLQEGRPSWPVPALLQGSRLCQGPLPAGLTPLARRQKLTHTS